MAGWTADQWWLIAGAVVALTGTITALWALAGQSTRGKRRCPKCWYELEGVEAKAGVWTCPECGRSVTRERTLFKRRRRWRWAAAALVLIIAGAAAMPYRAAANNGVWSLAPTWVLLWVVDAQGWPEHRRDYNPSLMGRLFQHTAATELHERARQRRLSESQWYWITERTLPTLLQWRGSWPRDVKLRVGYSQTALGSGMEFGGGYQTHLQLRGVGAASVKAEEERVLPFPFWRHPSTAGFVSDIHTDLGTPRQGPLEISGRFYAQFGGRLGSRPADRGPVRLEFTVPVRIVDSIDEVIRPVDSPELREALRAELQGIRLTVEDKWIAWETEKGTWISPRNFSLRLDLPREKRIAWSLRASLLRGQDTVATGSGRFLGRHHPSATHKNEKKLRLSDAALPLQFESGEWWLHIQGDGETALCAFDCDAYWSGRIVLPLTVVADANGVYLTPVEPDGETEIP